MANDEAEPELDEALAAAPVVIFRSSLTDLGPVRRVLEERGTAWREEVMGMGSARERERFGELKRQTGWKTLPMIFVDGRLVGGIDEFFAHAGVGLAPLGPAPASLTRTMNWLGYLGLAPFLATAVACWLPAQQAMAADVLVASGAIILTFVGAVHWGLALSAPAAPRLHPGAGVVPAVVGWLAVLVAAVAALPVLAASFAAFRGLELMRQPAMPKWFAGLRTHLTAGAVACLLLGWLALLA